MGLVTSRRALVWGAAALVFALCWTWAISSYGMVGLYAGWVPGLILAPLAGGLASFLWSIVALTVLLGWHCHVSDRTEGFR